MPSGLKSPGICLEAQWPLRVCRLGLAAIKGALALESVHKSLGALQTSHIMVYDFLGLLLPIFFIENS